MEITNTVFIAEIKRTPTVSSFRFKPEKKISFIPYGNRLDILMQEKNRRLDMENNPVFGSKFGHNGKKLPQIIWKVEKGIMLPVKEALGKNLIGNK